MITDKQIEAAAHALADDDGWPWMGYKSELHSEKAVRRAEYRHKATIALLL